MKFSNHTRRDRIIDSFIESDIFDGLDYLTITKEDLMKWRVRIKEQAINEYLKRFK